MSQKHTETHTVEQDIFADLEQQKRNEIVIKFKNASDYEKAQEIKDAVLKHFQFKINGLDVYYIENGKFIYGGTADSIAFRTKINHQIYHFTLDYLMNKVYQYKEINDSATDKAQKLTTR
ncbi:MAG: hypothetical protein ACRCXT_09825 [Paraclostridium sp.]